MRRLFTLPIVVALGFLPAVSGIDAAHATVAAPVLGTLEKQNHGVGPVTRVWYGGWGYGWRRPYWGGYYGYGWRRPYYGSYYGGHGCW